MGLDSNSIWQEFPLIKKLIEHGRGSPVPFHMPGHKMGREFPDGFKRDIFKMDLTELPGLDNLHYPEGAIQDACRLAAGAFGVQKTFFLVNGSSCGIHGAIMSLCREGDKIIVGRNCHRSVTGGIILSGAVPVYLPGKFDKETGILKYNRTEEIEKALDDHPDARGVILTRPDYYGICPDINEIARLIHSRGKTLIVDEAHGAHLKFNSRLPVCAAESGADIIIQSAHKTLPAVTQGAYLHVNSDRVSKEDIAFYLRLLQTTSPSYIIMATLDYARGIMEHFGESRYGELLDRIGEFEEKFHSLKFLAEKNRDKTRITINVGAGGFTGYSVLNKLRNYGIYPEMADLNNVVFITGPSNTREDFEKTGRALCKILAGGREEHNYDKNLIFADIPPLEGIRPSKVIGGVKVLRPIDLCENHVSTDFIVPYPPGIPAVFPGEIISKESIEYIKGLNGGGAEINGVIKEGAHMMVWVKGRENP